MTETYIFLLGNTPELSLIELKKILSIDSVERIQENIARLELDTATLDPVQLLTILGGTIKIFKQLEVLPLGTAKEEIEEILVAHLADDHDMKSFAICEIGRDHLEPIEASELKVKLKEMGIPSRYIDGSRHGLSSAILSHQKVTELSVLQSDKELVLTRTVAVQDIDAWTLRDRGKPYADRKKGMLPPKLARMMLNLALGPNPDPESTVLDPFCGSGTILLEALERGVNVVGNDLDVEAAQGSRENLDWYKTGANIFKTSAVFQQDATKLVLPNNQKVQYIVTEPFLGKPKPQPQQLANIFRGLEKQYLGSFKHWKTLLESGSIVVCVFPAVLASHTEGYPEVTLKSLIDKLAKFGYTTISEPVVYHRPQAVISRQIYQFVYKPE
jgi:tRNA G10  N-methylase Trm11